MNTFGSLLLLSAAVVGVSPANGAVVGQHKDVIDPGLNPRAARLMRKDLGTEEMNAVVGSDGHVSYSPEMADYDQDGEFNTNASLSEELIDLNDDSPPDINDDFDTDSLLEDNATDDEASGLSCSSISRLSGNTNHKVTPDTRIVASSYWHNRGDHGRGQMWRTRLNNHGTTWCAHHNRKNTWVQWDLGGDKIVTRSLIMGRHTCHQWIKGYKILYKSSKVNWKWYGGGKVLPGGNWRWCRVNTLKPVLARWIRIYAQTWHNHISMRADWDGCAPSVPGPKGAQGARGTPGARGATGARGPPGPPGAKGVGGVKGATGARGAAGQKGDKGVVGHVGPKGERGLTPAPIDCVWAEWDDYSDCTKSCGTTDPGTQVRSRSFKVDPQNGGKNCEGKMFETKKCNVKECPTTTTTTTTKPAKSSTVLLRANYLLSVTLLAAASISSLS
jgi:hypothetical protein